MPFSITGATGCISGTPNVTVYDSTGRVKLCLPPTPPGTVLWGSITGTVTNQTDLINYLNLNFYPLSTNPAGYLTDAPSDGSTYGRNNGAWTVVSGSAILLALPFTTDHLTATSNPYVIGDVVYYLGNVYRCIANNDSILPTNASYWTSLGAGFPLVQQPSDWNSTSGNNQILNKPTIPSITPDALTKTDDTNVTLTLGGTPATALLQATSLTLGWTGTLATSRGGTGLATIGSDGQLIRVNTGATALEYFTPTYLTAVPTLQEVLIAGSTLTQDNTIDGGGFTQIFDNNYKFNINAEQLVGLQATDGTKLAQFNLYPQSNNTNWRYDDGGGNVTDIEMTGVKMYVRTPGYATATNGDILTLINNTSGEVEFQTPTTTTGDSLSPLLLMGG